MARRCVRDLPHVFDPVSGWCMHGCGWRDDGRSQYRPTPPDAIDVPDITEARRQPQPAPPALSPNPEGDPE